MSRVSGPILLSITFIVLGALPMQAHAQAAQRDSNAGEISLSDDSMQLRYIRPQTRLDEDIETGELGLGVFLNEERDIVVNANFYIDADRVRVGGLSLMLGPVAYAALLSEENNEVFALALGAEARYQLLRRPEVTLVGRAAYAPDILTFGSGDRLWDVIGRVEMPLTDRVTGFGGYRLFEIDLFTGKTELEESIHFGLRYRF